MKVLFYIIKIAMTSSHHE